MKLSTVLEKVHPTFGHTSLVAGALHGDLASISQAPATITTTITRARADLAEAIGRQERCTSDAAWWGFEGQRVYCAMLVNLLEAALITGPDHLPDVDYPASDGMVMNIYADQEAFGEEVLRQAQEQTG